MLEFRKIELCDKLKVEEYLSGSNFRGCEYTFGNIFLWSNYYNTEICITDEFCFEKINEDNNIHFVYPYGNGQVKTAVNSIIGYSEHNNIRPVICANKEITGKILDLYPNAKANLYRDFCDYIWLENLNLRGGYKKTIFDYIDLKYPELLPLYKEIYTYKDMSYWKELDEEISAYEKENDFMYIIDEEPFIKSPNENPIISIISIMKR